MVAEGVYMKVPDGDRKFSPDTGTYSRQPRPCAARPPQPDDHRRGADVGVSARTSRRSPVVLPEGPATAARQRALLRAPARVPLARAARGTRGGRSPMAPSVRLVVRVVFVPAGGARATRGAGSPKVLLRAASAAAPSEARAARVRRAGPALPGHRRTTRCAPAARHLRGRPWHASSAAPGASP